MKKDILLGAANNKFNTWLDDWRKQKRWPPRDNPSVLEAFMGGVTVGLNSEPCGQCGLVGGHRESCPQNFPAEYLRP